MIDHNPALPHVSGILHRHKHLIERDPRLQDLVPAGSVFVSYRKNKTIGDSLIHNRFKPSTQVTPVSDHPGTNPVAVSDSNNLISGCFACGKCYCCKLGYLTPCEGFSSYHTTQVFNINKIITCQSVGVIYLAECITCETSCVGYSVGNLPKRLSNHRSHIKKNIKTCRLTSHFIEKDHSIIRDQTQKEFNDSLVKHLKLILIDTVDFPPGLDTREKERLCEEREGYWQTSLKSFEKFGGMNVLDSRLSSQRTRECPASVTP